MKEQEQIAMLFVSMGEYRLNSMQLVERHFGERLRIYSGSRAPAPGIRVIDPEQIKYQAVRNVTLPRGIVLQLVNPVRLTRPDTLVMDLNPRLPLVWIILLLRNCFGKRTILWGHAFPRKGPRSRGETVRRVLRKLASQLITYTATQASELQLLHPKKAISSAPNSIYKAEQFTFAGETTRDSFIYVGRLTAEKKPLLALHAFELAAVECEDMRLVIVGDGPMLEEVKEQANRSMVKERIMVLGHESRYDELRKLYSSAIASLSPGYVGLSVTQSLSFGVPMIVARNEPHAPEIEAVVEGQNARFFRSDDVYELACMLMEFYDERENWADRGTNISSVCRARYSAEAMARGLIEALEEAH